MRTRFIALSKIVFFLNKWFALWFGGAKHNLTVLSLSSFYFWKFWTNLMEKKLSCAITLLGKKATKSKKFESLPRVDKISIFVTIKKMTAIGFMLRDKLNEK